MITLAEAKVGMADKVDQAVIDEFRRKPALLKFISKNLSWGIFNKSILKIYENGENKEDSIFALFMKGVEENHLNLQKPEVTLFMIIELVSSTCFTSISPFIYFSII